METRAERYAFPKEICISSLRPEAGFSIFPYKSVEGLMRSNALKPQDRPLWWDVYRAFPPTQDPVFSRPLPTRPIQKIFYPEDEIRGKFHKSKQSLGTVKLTNEEKKSNCQRFIAIYNNIESTTEIKDNKDVIFNEAIDSLNEYFALKSEFKDQLTEKNDKVNNSKELEHNDKNSIKTTDNVLKDIFK